MLQRTGVPEDRCLCPVFSAESRVEMALVPGEGLGLILGSHRSVLERAVVGSRWSEASLEQSRSHAPHHPHLAVRYCKKSGCSSLNFSADASGPKYFCGLQQGEEEGRACVTGVPQLPRLPPSRDSSGVRAAQPCSHCWRYW